jgi:hypothetical protein
LATSDGVLPPQAVDAAPADLADADELWRYRTAQAVRAFVALGIVVRLARYLLRFPLWGDECALAANFLDRTYLDLIRPLDYQQVCPLLFLWIELSAVKVLGFTEWSLRLFPCLCSMASVILFWHVARRLLRGETLALAVGIFAVSYYPIRHGAETKPYAADLFASLVLLALAIEWWRSPEKTRWLWALTLAAPVALGLSFPAVFVAGGVSVALVPIVWQAGNRHAWTAYATHNAVLVTSFAGLYFVFLGPQIDAASTEGVMQAYWSAAFPPLSSPVRLLTWLAEMHSSQMFAYPIGGERGASVLSLISSAVALVFLYRRRRATLLTLCLVPLALNFVAAALGRYPYGGSARVALYLAPIICLLTGLGAGRMLSLIRAERARRGTFVGLALVLAGLGAAMLVRDVIRPFKTEYDQRVRDFHRCFWAETGADAELVCARTDLKQDFFGQSYAWRGIAQYLCNQRIHSTRHRRGGVPRWDRVSAARPLRCVVFSVPTASRDEAAVATWLADMQAHYRLTGHETHDFPKSRGHPSHERQRIEVYEFSPK